MKFGVRKPNIKTRIKARTTGRVKRAIKRSINPIYGKRGMGMLHPKKKIYNAVYKRTTIGIPTPSLSIKGTSHSKKRVRSTKRVTGTVYLSGLLVLGAGCIITAFYPIIGVLILISAVLLLLSHNSRISQNSIPQHDPEAKTLPETNSSEEEKANSCYMDTRAEVITKWSTITKDPSPENTKYYELLCKKNIREYYTWMETAKQNPKFEKPTRVDAFIKLAMLYDKLGRYEEAIAVCDEALKAGAFYDGTKSGMQGRKERLLKKASTRDE